MLLLKIKCKCAEINLKKTPRFVEAADRPPVNQSSANVKQL